MSKKFEVTSCHMCPHYSQYDHDGTVYDTTMAQCSAYADGDTVVGRVFEDVLEPNYIWDECPLESYYASFANQKPIVSRRVVSNAFGLKEKSPLRQEYDTHISTPEMVTLAPVPVDMMQLMVLIDDSYSSNSYYAPNGSVYNDHPSKVNEFMQRVGESGGNIVSVNYLETKDRYTIRYSVPVGTYPIYI